MRANASGAIFGWPLIISTVSLCYTVVSYMVMNRPTHDTEASSRQELVAGDRRSIYAPYDRKNIGSFGTYSLGTLCNGIW